ncbi:calcineurin-like phosphoesterase family protein [Dysgonomonas alginatilytica]|uniref:Calcineurin-like phosphoesterase family protein n=1 Tax=Dysgonomonas alginatilytica TaxID=1605892 RepID=A0A2V3PLI9_9BACT|nr:metallophosphoesterase [Dysgonomonas alginatilytica]PXV60972.1 calcineurin-like phosphoesterase family protein [Dysgonomonas alginatilytica]
MYTRILILSLLFSPFLKGQEAVNFTLFTDIHQDIINDADIRLRDIFEAAEKNSSQFIIQLGDFAMQKPDNKIFVDFWLNYPMEKYSVLGNHDMDIGTKEEYIEYLRMKAPYYYFDKGIFRFIVLDTNYFIDADGETIDYADSNYYGKKNDRISSKQLDWLETLLKDRSKQIILFTHAPVDGTFDDNESFVALRGVLDNAKLAGATIVGVLSGHNHIDNHTIRDGINYMQINSASYVWVGERYADRTRFPESVYQTRSALPYTVPYRSALYANISIDSKARLVSIKGSKSSFIPPSPQELDRPEQVNNLTQEKVVSSALITDITCIY